MKVAGGFFHAPTAPDGAAQRRHSLTTSSQPGRSTGFRARHRRHNSTRPTGIDAGIRSCTLASQLGLASEIQIAQALAGHTGLRYVKINPLDLDLDVVTKALSGPFARRHGLVAISMAPTGWPQALFTLNLWAIGDRYTSPGKLDRYTREYGVDSRKGDVRLVRFINLMFRAFRPEIEALQVAKGKAIEQYRATHSGADPFEDRSVEILSRIEIEIPRDLPPSRKSLNL